MVQIEGRMKRFFFTFILSSSLLVADYINFYPAAEGPWFTGTLITPSAYSIPFGHYNLEPYLSVNNTFGLFNKHWHEKTLPETVSNINLQFWAQMGVNSFMDFTIVPSFYYNYVGEEESSWRFGDLFAQLGFQLSKQQGAKGFAARFTIGELFPTGTYQHLDIRKLGTDASGGGSFVTFFQFIFAKRWNTYTFHYLAARMSAGCSLYSQVCVHGLNSYGGDKTTKGRVFPGTSFPLLFGFEYNMTQNWVLALDIINQTSLKTRFKGSTTFPVGWRWQYNLSFAPAIEYNYSQNVGLIAGVWFAPVGRVSQKFINYVMALNWYI